MKDPIQKEHLQTAEGLMNAFAEETLPDEEQFSSETRYLWTDAFAVCNFLELHKNTEKKLPSSGKSDLSREIEEMRPICSIDSWATSDPLGIGGLLFDAFRLGILLGKESTRSLSSDLSLLHTLLSDSLRGHLQYSKQFSIMPLSYRLAFRELGLSISLHSLNTFIELVENSRHFEAERESLLSLLKEIKKFLPLGREIESTWLNPKNRETPLWLEHKHINSVMLATSLAPGQFLSL